MAFVVEVPLEADDMLLVLWIGLHELLKDLNFLHSGFAPKGKLV